MGDITGLNTFTSGTTLDEGPVNDNFYSESATSFRAINGYLDSDNMDASWSVTTDQVRNQNLANGKMVGLTGNLDYIGELFSADETDSTTYVPIPGASISFHLPYAPSLVILSWMVVITNSSQISAYTTAEKANLRFYLNNEQVSFQIRGCPPTYDAITSNARLLFRDRIWSGHSTQTDLAKGFHTASIRIHFPDSTAEKMARVRVRNIKVIYFK
tara:strand:- start:186 stop:830 length:645 start_codon:yes stop_codon:yes gene_type:complete